MEGTVPVPQTALGFAIDRYYLLSRFRIGRSRRGGEYLLSVQVFLNISYKNNWIIQI